MLTVRALMPSPTVISKIFHGRVHELFDRFGQSMNLVDEQDRTLFGIGEIGQQILGCG